MAAKPRSLRTARDNARARALGYRDYYDWRAHDNGRIPPDRPRLRGERLRRARGHDGPEDLIRFLRPGDLILLEHGIGSVESTIRRRRVKDRRFKRGFRVVTEQVFKRVDKLVRPADSRPARVFRVVNHTRAMMERLIERERAKGAIWSPSPSLDQRRLLTENEVDGGY